MIGAVRSEAGSERTPGLLLFPSARVGPPLARGFGGWGWVAIFHSRLALRLPTSACVHLGSSSL